MEDQAGQIQLFGEKLLEDCVRLGVFVKCILILSR